MCGALPWPSLMSESAGVIRLHVADARDFLDQQYGTATARAGTAGATLPCYLTSFSKVGGRRRWPCGKIGACDLSAGPSSGIIVSHNAFNSESAIRLSFIRSWRIATDTNDAVSWSVLAMRTARHSSRVARTECNRCSELATGVFSVTELTR
jgi:hypothetical protein